MENHYQSLKILLKCSVYISNNIYERYRPNLKENTLKNNLFSQNLVKGSDPEFSHDLSACHRISIVCHCYCFSLSSQAIYLCLFTNREDQQNVMASTIVTISRPQKHNGGNLGNSANKSSKLLSEMYL